MSSTKAGSFSQEKLKMVQIDLEGSRLWKGDFSCAKFRCSGCDDWLDADNQNRIVDKLKRKKSYNIVLYVLFDDQYWSLEVKIFVTCFVNMLTKNVYRSCNPSNGSMGRHIISKSRTDMRSPPYLGLN